jgi:hypothetical protein
MNDCGNAVDITTPKKLKKKIIVGMTGIWLFSAMAYVAWCLRSFYISPDLEFDITIPYRDRDSIKHSATTEELPPPLRWEIEKAIGLIRNPAESKISNAIVTRVDLDDHSRIVISHDSGWWIMRKLGDQWRIEKMSVIPKYYK